MNTCPVDRQPFSLILVRASVNGKVVRQIPIEATAQQNEEEAAEDPTYCEVCGMSDREDRMLLCDGCDLGFHLECLNPPLQAVPVGSWYCDECADGIGIYEVQLLLDEAETWPEGSRRRAVFRR